MKKPRVRFCWECGRKLWGNHHVILNIQGYDRTLHKQCGNQYKNGVEDHKQQTKEDIGAGEGSKMIIKAKHIQSGLTHKTSGWSKDCDDVYYFYTVCDLEGATNHEWEKTTDKINCKTCCAFLKR